MKDLGGGECGSGDREVLRSDFPEDFLFGVATSAFQVEGGRKEGGRGDNIWDVFAEEKGNIRDGSNGDVSVDQYHRYKEDVELISKLGFKAYRFSLSWSRIFPDGFGAKLSEDGVSYYNNLINTLLDKGIQPSVTLYHWDLPYSLQHSFEGWLNAKIVEYFSIYAETCFELFGDRVKHWVTINEPLQTALNGHENGTFAPGKKDNPLTEPYLAAHHQLLAHASAVFIYRKKFKKKQGGQIGLVVDSEWAEPFSDEVHDKTAAARCLDFTLGWFLDPIFFGDYPKTMRDRLGKNLPQFTDEEKELLHNSLDFVGLNHYTTRLIAHQPNPDNVKELEKIVSWPGGEAIGPRAASDWLYVVPWGLKKILNYIVEKYKNPIIYVTENGMDDEDEEITSIEQALDDKMRVDYFKGYLASVAQAIRDGADVRGYFVWSLLDNFEWAQGYTKRFGIVYVDYENGFTRHLKASARWFSQFLSGPGSIKEF